MRAGYRRGGGFDHGERGARAQSQLQIPRHQIQVALAAHLAPQGEHGNQRDQKQRGIRQTEDRHGSVMNFHLTLS